MPFLTKKRIRKEEYTRQEREKIKEKENVMREKDAVRLWNKF
jgi:hypothetical protein